MRNWDSGHVAIISPEPCTEMLDIAEAQYDNNTISPLGSYKLHSSNGEEMHSERREIVQI